jgi:hypothetical protein
MGAAVAVIMLRERQVAETFERAGATSPESARRPDELGLDGHGVGWRRLHQRAVVREAGPGSGRYYLDVEVLRAVRRTRRRMAVVLLILIALVAVGVMAPLNR